jgi:integrase
MARLRLKHVNAFICSDGRVRHYFRRGGAKAIPLPGLPGSEEFMAAYGAALAVCTQGTNSAEIGAGRTSPGSISALVVTYYKSSAWGDLEEGTRKMRWRIIERFREKHGNKRVALLKQEHIERLLGEIDRPSAKRHWLTAIRALLRSAIPGMRKDDPTAAIPRIKIKTKGHKCWTDSEIETYRAHWPLGTQQRLVMELALETVSRLGEVVRLGPQHVRDGHIRIARIHGSRDVNILVSPELQAACDAMPKAHLTFITTKDGKPRSKVGLGNDFAKWVTAAGLPKHCRLHGLKKGGMSRLAVDGATTHELMAVSGHRTLSEVQRYTDAVDRERLAGTAMAKKRTPGAREQNEVTNIDARTYKQSKKAL